MAYAKRWSTGFTDNDAAKPEDAQFLNAVEAALLKLLDADPGTVGMVPAWNGTKYAPKLITHSEIDAAAGILYTQLNLGGGVTNADIAGSAGITPSKIANYPNDTAKFLRGDGSWTAPSVVGFGTSLPGSPADGDEYVYIADATNGVLWRFKYKSSLAKWVFLSGRPLYAEVATAQTRSANTYGALSTAGPIVTVPLAGSYDIEHGFSISTLSGTLSANARMAFTVGATAASDTDSVYGVARGSFSRKLPTKTGIAASTALTEQYKSDGTVTVTFENRWIEVYPALI